MQRKTIEKIIRKKLGEWLESISKENPELAKDVKANILLSGGSIVSMFLQKDVNDYDIYIKDVNVLRELAHHYIKKYPDRIRIFDGRYKEELESNIPDYYDENDIISKDANKSAYACAVRNLRPDQMKLFFADRDNGANINKRLKMDNKGNKDKYHVIFYSPNAISLSDKIQIVLRFHGDSKAIHETFDFIHATNYFTYEEGLVTNVAALESILTKQLRYQGSFYPLTSIIRMKKFIERGWSISAGEILKIMYQISVLNLNDPDVLEEQLIGVDIAYFSVIIDLLRGRDESQGMTSGYLNELIDKVFNAVPDEDEESGKDD